MTALADTPFIDILETSLQAENTHWRNQNLELQGNFNLKGIRFVTRFDEGSPRMREKNETHLTVMTILYLGRKETEVGGRSIA